MMDTFIQRHLYNKNTQLAIVGILFIVWFFLMCINCPCGYKNVNKRKGCYRFEIFGVQTNHLYFFIFLGYFFSEYFYLIQSAGVLWELFEMYLDKNEKFAFSLGGCLGRPDYKLRSEWYYKHLVTERKEKYLNPLDAALGIQTSKKHGWHGSVAEIVVNLIGFGIGSYAHKHFAKYENSAITFIFLLVLMEILF